VPEQLIASLQVQVVGGPRISASHSLQITAYDKIMVVIPGSDKGDPTVPVTDPANAAVPSIDVEVQPSSSTDRVEFLSISSDRYGSDLVYSVDGGVAGVSLDSTHVFVGNGAVGLLEAAPQTLSFRNGLGAGRDATVTILAGRNATS
jgi:hypothetical protein